jgi:hypothetical protein
MFHPHSPIVPLIRRVPIRPPAVRPLVAQTFLSVRCYSPTPATLPNAAEQPPTQANSRRINTCVNAAANPFRMRTYKISSLQPLWNEHLQKRWGRGYPDYVVQTGEMVDRIDREHS